MEPSNPATMHVHPTPLAQRLVASGCLTIGSSFVFLRPPDDEPGLEWLEGPRVISRLNRPVELPGLTVEAAAVQSLGLAILTSDKALYAVGREPVHLLAYDPVWPASESSASVYQDSVHLRDWPLQLDELGVAHLVLTGLGAGSYRVVWKSAVCVFRVAAYRLAPLVAVLARQERDGDLLQLELGLSSYGSPLDGPVSLELVDRGVSLNRAEGFARNGRIEAVVPLAGEGPLSLNVQSLADPSHTASVPLVGTRQADRDLTILSRLGRRLTASMLPGPDSQEVRGLYLRDEDPEEDAPLLLDRLGGARIRLTARRALEALRVVVMDPSCCSPRLPGPASARAVLARMLLAEGSRDEAAALLEQPVSSEEQFLRGSLRGSELEMRRALLNGYVPGPADEGLPTGGPRPSREVARERMEAGQALELDLPAPLAVLYLGAFLEGVAWEDRAVLPVPSNGLLCLKLPECVHPDEATELKMEGSAQAAYVVVKDARLLTPDTPGSALASRLKAHAQEQSQRSLARPAPIPAPPRPAFTPMLSPPRWTEDLRQELLSRRLLTPRQLERALESSQRTGAPLHSCLVALGLLSERDVLEAVAAITGVRFLDLESAPIDPEVARSIPEQLSARYRVLPVAQAENQLTLAMTDPLNVIAIDDIQLITGFEVDPVLAGESAMTAALTRLFGVSELVEVESTMMDISAQDFAPVEEGGDESICLDRLADLSDAPAPRQAAPQSLQESPQTLFAGLVRFERGRASLSLSAGSGAASLVVEVLGLAPGDWSFQTERLDVRKSPHVALEAPAFVQPGDVALGRVVVVSGKGLLHLTREGQPVLTQAVSAGQTIPFPAFPGVYQARLEEPGGATDESQADVCAPGRMTRLTRAICLLSSGQSLDLEGLLHYRVRSNPGTTLAGLVEATANYSHACCEQTAAIMLAASVAYVLAASDPPRRAWAESVILAGVARERLMHLPGRGFKIYPHMPDQADQYYGPIAALYLWNLGVLEDLAGALRDGVAQALEMAADATRAYGLSWPPDPPRDPQQAYALARLAPERAQVALEWARQAADQLGPKGDQVAYRAESAYIAATLLRLGGDVLRPQALSLANQVLKCLESNGRLYSTLDSVAAMALVQELSCSGAGRVELGGREQTLSEAVAAGGQTGPLRVLEGEALVEVTRHRTEDWSQGSPGLLEAWLEQGQSRTRRVRAGDRLQLEWSLPQDYQLGDLLWVCLPDALSRLEGGGQLKLFSIDLQGASAGGLELVATGPTPAGPQHFQLCLRNMFVEERLGPSELLSILVDPPVASEPPTQSGQLPVSLLPTGSLKAWALDAGSLEMARDLLSGLTRGCLELATGRREQGWLSRDGGAPEPLSSVDSLRLGVGLMRLAELKPGGAQMQEGQFRFADRSYRLQVLPTDVGLRARLEVL